MKQGESKTVIFKLNTDDLAFIGFDNKPVAEPGEFKISIADLSKTLEVQ